MSDERLTLNVVYIVVDGNKAHAAADNKQNSNEGTKEGRKEGGKKCDKLGRVK